jgi:hypothetical protein
MAVPIIAAGLMFACTPVAVADGDGPVWCAEGPHVRIAGIAARELDGSCRPGQPCPPASAIDARNALVTILGGPRGQISHPGTAMVHIRVQAPAMRCLSTGSAGGTRTGASCVMASGTNLSCAMLATRTVLAWGRYWPRGLHCTSRPR